MFEVLATPGWDNTGTPLARWVEGFAALGFEARAGHESPGVSWLDVPALALRGYAMLDGPHVEAINFEAGAADPAPALGVLGKVATALGWELDDEQDLEEDDG